MVGPILPSFQHPCSLTANSILRNDGEIGGMGGIEGIGGIEGMGGEEEQKEWEE